MKTLHTILLVACAVLPNVAAASSRIRGVKTPEDTISDSSVRQLDEEDDDILGTIQAILDGSLADTNFVMREHLEDPLPLSLSASVPLGCNALALQMEFHQLKGLSSIDVQNLTAQAGTETTVPDWCDDTAWGSAVDIYVAFTESLVSGQVTARVVGRCDGILYDQPLSVGISSTGVYYTGTYNMKGILGPNGNAISDAETLGKLTLNTPATTVSMSLFPDALAAYQATATSQLEAAFRSQLVNEVEPHLRKTLEDKIPSIGVNFFKGAIKALRGFLYEFLGDVEGDSGSKDSRGDDDYDDYFYDDDDDDF